MAGQKFEFDESGTTFLPFILSFMGLVLLIGTYYFWPTSENDKDSSKEKKCKCKQCQVKEGILKKKEPNRKVKLYAIRLSLIIGWILFAFIAYKVTQTDPEIVQFDPYAILGIQEAATTAQIKRAYHKLSLIYHPDKPTGDEKLFMDIAKAYQALTDETARSNWELYGNPDGPRAMSFGIALPSWIVDKENSVWVLGLYALVFMVALPVTVGIWWYRSIQYSSEKVLLETTQLHQFFIYKTPQMPVKRAIMVLGASLEFEKGHNSEMLERPTDIEEIPKLLKLLPHVNEKNKERPLCHFYSVKARALLHAHISRTPLPPDTLELDRQLIVTKCPLLIQEMITCISQLVMFAHFGKIPKSKLPSLDTVDSVMTMSQMIVQALWYVKKNPLFQLPHVTEDMQRYLKTKKGPIKSIRQLCEMKDEDRRLVFRNFTDEQYSDILRVCANMPLVDFHVECEVLDDEEPSVITAGSMVTVFATLTRKSMGSCLQGDIIEKEITAAGEEHSSDEEDDDENKATVVDEEGEEDSSVAAPVSSKPAKLVWQKQRKGGKKSGGNKKNQKQQPKKVAPVSNKSSSTLTSKPGSETEELINDAKNDNRDHRDSDELSDSDSKDVDQEEAQSSHEVDEQEWEKCQTELSKNNKRALEGKSVVSHSVHCPYFPDDKQEYWWLYVCDEKKKSLLSIPYLVTNLVSSEECKLQFSAPSAPGKYQYTVCLRSDSYFGFDQFVKINLDVKPAKEIKEHPQWEFPEEEEEEEEEDESDLATDSEEDDEDLKKLK